MDNANCIMTFGTEGIIGNVNIDYNLSNSTYITVEPLKLTHIGPDHKYVRIHSEEVRIHAWPYDENEISVYEELKTLKNQMSKIMDKLETFEKRFEAIETHIMFMPDGEGYHEAKKEFDELNK